MYADKLTDSIKKTLAITEQRRALQQTYNEKNNITPRSVRRDKIEELAQTFGEPLPTPQEKAPHLLTHAEIDKMIEEYGLEMRRAAKELRFEDAAQLRDLMRHYENLRLLEGNL